MTVDRAGAAAPWEIDAPRPAGSEGSPPQHGDGTQRSERLFVGRPQNLRAMDRANTIRLARVCEKRRIAGMGVVSAPLGLAELLEAPLEDHLKTATLADAIRWMPRWGDLRTRQLLLRLGIGELRTLGSLTSRECRRTAAALRGDLEVLASWETV